MYMIYVVLNIQHSQVKAIHNSTNMSNLIKTTHCFEFIRRIIQFNLFLTKLVAEVI